MGFVKSAEELREFEHLLASPRLVTGEAVQVHLLLDRQNYERLLPPPLRPTATPRASVIIGRWQSSHLGDSAGGVIHLRAEYDGIEGSYPLTGWFDSEQVVTFGREVIGEPLKLATSGLYRSGGHARGWVDRRGVRLVDLDVELGAEELTSQNGDAAQSAGSESRRFNIRGQLVPDGAHFATDPVITSTEVRSVVFARRSGTARIELSGGPHDPLDELSVVDVTGASWVEFEQTASTSVVGRVPAADFLPYHLGRNDNWPLMSSPSGASLGDARGTWW